MNKRIFFLIGFFFFGLSISGFGQIKKAKRLMELYEYTKAISVLENEVSKKNNNTDKEAYLLLGECYLKKNDILSARGWYEKAIEKGNTEPVNYYNYAQLLRTLGEYQQSKTVFLKYMALAHNDKRGAIYAGYCDSVVVWKNKPVTFDIKNTATLNTKYGDFGSTIYHNGIIYTSDRVNTSKESKVYGWTGNQFLKLYYAEPVYPNDYYNGFKASKLEGRPFNLLFHDGPACFAQNDSLLYITRSNMSRVENIKGNQHIKTHVLKIFYSQHSGNKWSAFKPFFLNSDKYSVGHPALTPDGKTLYFISDMPGGYGGTDVYMCKWEYDKWGNPINLGPKINSFGNEMFPTIASTGELYFSSDGWPGYGGLDIFVTSKVNGEWTIPLNLHQPINSSYDDFSLMIKKDKSSGLLSSNRKEGMGNDDIYSFKVKPNTPNILDKNALTEIKNAKDSSVKVKEKPLFFVSGYVKDKITNKPINHATVFMLDEDKGEVLVLKTDSIGFFRTVVKKETPYVVRGMQTGFIADCEPFIFDTLNKKTELSIPRDLLLDKLDVNKVFKVENIYYDFDKWNIRADAKPELDKLVRIMKENPINIELGSHTDCRGSFAYNDGLSQRRAESAVSYIISQGISTGRLFARGYGERQLINQCKDGVQCSEEEHQANRRTEFKIISSFEDTNKELFDLNKYKKGFLYDFSLFPSYFFSNCSSNPPKTEQKPVLKNEVSVITSHIETEPKVTHFETSKTQLKPVEKKEVAASPTVIKTDPKTSSTETVKLQSKTVDKVDIFTGYKVQIVASIKPVSLDKIILQFNLKEQIREDHIDKWYRYSIGAFQSYKEAFTYMNTICTQNKIKQAFIVKFVDGKRVD